MGRFGSGWLKSGVGEYQPFASCFFKMYLNPGVLALPLDSNHRAVPEFLVVYPAAQYDVTGSRRRNVIRFGLIWS